jgi:ATP-dependent RNA helicase DeaD
LEETQGGFPSLKLSPPVLSALERANYFEPTPIQAAFIPEVLRGRDVIGQAQTGTGKTAAFLLPFLHHWKPTARRGPQALVLAPTRELVVQVAEEARKLAPCSDCRAVAIYGGQRFKGQFADLKAGCALVVGTPGRILDHLDRGTLSFDEVRYVVLDEADRMLDIGFRPDIEDILRECPKKRQTLLLSATMPPQVLRLTHRYMREPVHVNLSPARITVEGIQQLYFTVDEDRKFSLLLHVLQREKPRQAIIFCETKRGTDRLYQRLRDKAAGVAVMHGDMPQDHRNKIMKRFREGEVVFLCATDVVGRGIDVQNISHIINYDLPRDPESYVHRIGRTGRMGANGVAITFVMPGEGEELTKVESFINMLLTEDRIAGFRAFAPKDLPEKQPAAAAAPRQPVFGQRVRRRSNRL